ncbi:uncharacterized protein LOC127882239 isoform X2 [Dreissena polymorpha]|nr:uncharacterized protein LOC127882239 isoform X2 [Dreissena polymorpha]
MGTAFGVKTSQQENIECVCMAKFGNLNETSCTYSCDHQYMCGKENKYAVYNIIKVEAIPSFTYGLSCLDYYYVSSELGTCSGRFNRLLCSSVLNDNNRVAAVQDVNELPTSWSEANIVCLNNGLMPATIESIQNGQKFGTFRQSDDQPHWTGVIQTHTFLKADNHDQWALEKVFAFVTIDGNIDFKVDRLRHRLCIGVPPVPSTVEQNTPFTMMVTQQPPADAATQSNTAKITSWTTTLMSTAQHTKTSQVQETSTVAIAVGITFGFIFMIAGVVVIVLYKRGSIPCNKKTENEKHLEDNPELEEHKSHGKSIEENVPNHNYFILEKCEQSIKDNVERYNEASEANMDEDYNTLQETGESFEKNGNYDCTTNVLTSGFNARKPDNIYNKLKIGRPGDYDQGIQGQEGAKASDDDYDTTLAVLTHVKDDISDYNHIPLTAYNADGTGDDIKGNKGGDYDAINSMKFKVVQSDSLDYTLVKKDRMN